LRDPSRVLDLARERRSQTSGERTEAERQLAREDRERRRRAKGSTTQVPAETPPLPPPSVESHATVKEPAVREEPDAVETPPTFEGSAETDIPAVSGSSAESHPSAVSDPSAMSDSSTVSDPSAVSRPSAVSGPSAESDPLAVSDPSAMSDPLVESDSSAMSDPSTVSDPSVVSRPSAVPDPPIPLEPAGVPDDLPTTGLGAAVVPPIAPETPPSVSGAGAPDADRETGPIRADAPEAARVRYPAPLPAAGAAKLPRASRKARAKAVPPPRLRHMHAPHLHAPHLHRPHISPLRRGAARVGALLALVVALAALSFGVVLLVRHGNHPKPAPLPAVVKVVIPEGDTRVQIAALAHADGLRGSYLAAAKSSSELRPSHYGAGSATPNLEGFLFPASYEMYRGASAAQLVSEQLAAFKENFGSVEFHRAKTLGITPYQLLIVASIIEREAAIPHDRPLVAAVVYNRLRENMTLGVDSTLRYALHDFTHPLTETELASSSPYNTRTHKGLPPTPISNPGSAAIAAAGHPAKVSYLYYVAGADGCGEQVFSTSYTQFEKNAAAYREALSRNGGRVPTCKKG
jgi:UPF0755 protein